MPNINLFSFLERGTKHRELADTRASWERVEREWKASPLANLDMEEAASTIVRSALADLERVPAAPVLAALCEATEELFRAEAVTEIEPLWKRIEDNVEVAVHFREMLTRRSRWATEYPNLRKSFGRQLGAAYRLLVAALPESCFTERQEGAVFGVPLIDLLENPAEVIEEMLRLAFSKESLYLDLFRELRLFLRQNLLAASGIPSEAAFQERERRLI